MAERDDKDRFWPRDLTVGAGFDGGTGRYGNVLTTGRDGRGRFRRRNEPVGAGFVDGTGR